jgi:hypothetical protein
MSGDVLLGEPEVASPGLALGVVHAGSGDAAGGAVSAVAFLAPDAATTQVIDLSPTPADAPAPRLSWRGANARELVALTRSIPRGLALYRAGMDGQTKLLFRVGDTGDDVGASDVANADEAGVVVWEGTKAGSTPPSGVIRVAAFEGEGKPAAAHDLSSHDSDAEGPRVVAVRGGFLVVWSAGTVEAGGSFDGSATAEVVSESPAARWLEAAVLDAHGSPTGPARRFTTGGHVASFDVQADPSGGGALVVSREGSIIERFRLHADGTAESPVTLAADGVGSGTPTFLAGARRWVAWWGPSEQLVLVPLGGAGGPAGAPSSEDAFGEAQPLVSLGNERILALAPAGPAGPAQLEFFSCSTP